MRHAEAKRTKPKKKHVREMDVDKPSEKDIEDVEMNVIKTRTEYKLAYNKIVKNSEGLPHIKMTPAEAIELQTLNENVKKYRDLLAKPTLIKKRMEMRNIKVVK